MVKFVSRAGDKLQFAFASFKISLTNLTCADFGSSTGGFVDCLLQNGARKVYAVDTAYGELAWTLRNTQKVVVMERTNAMHVELPEKVDLITIDVAWTRQEHIIPNALANLKASGRIITLIKPHYEAPKRYVSQGKLQADKISEVLESVERDIAAVGGIVQKMVKSPILGGKAKNEEYLALVVQAQS